MNRLAWPIALRPSKVGGGPPVEGSRRQDLGWRKAVELSSTRAREEVLEPVPVVAPQSDEILCSHLSGQPGEPLANASA